VLLFDQFQREDTGPALYGESDFAYLNRSARTSVDRIRRNITEWFGRYPASERGPFRKRFRSPDDIDHRSVWFELFLHELITRLGARIEVHPAVPGTTRRPDFLIESPGAASCYLEATVASGLSREQRITRKVENRVYDHLNRVLIDSDFFLVVEVVGHPRKTPPVGELTRFIKSQMALLDPDVLARNLEARGGEAGPKWRYDLEGWTVTFQPLPKSPASRGKPGVRPIVGWSEGGPARPIDPRTPLRDAVMRKASRYGVPDLPYVVAVNALDSFVDRTAIMEALVGAEQILYYQTPDGGTRGPIPTRARDGVWWGPHGPRATRVSAVLVAQAFNPWPSSWETIRLYHNPYARIPYEGVLNRLHRALPEGDGLRFRDGELVQAIFHDCVDVDAD
jgi:hypothetical protein